MISFGLSLDITQLISAHGSHILNSHPPSDMPSSVTLHPVCAGVSDNSESIIPCSGLLGNIDRCQGYVGMSIAVYDP